MADQLAGVRVACRSVLKRGATPLGLLAFSLVVALLLAEATVRIVAPQQLILLRPDIWQPADGLGWIHRPNVSTTINTGERTVSFHTDREGFRVGEAGRREAETQVLLIGDSMMEALQVEHEESFAHLFETQLGNRLGTPVAVRNAAVSGWDVSHYLLQTRRLLRHHTFALVVVALYLGNDTVEKHIDYFPPRANLKRHGFRLPRRLSQSEFIATIALPLNNLLEVRSHLRMRLGLTADHFPIECLRSEAHSQRWRVTAEIAQSLAETARSEGTPALFVLVPSSSEVNERVLDNLMRGFGIDPTRVDVDQPNRILYQELAARGLCVIAALPAFRESATRGARLFGTVDAHMSPAGHRILAEVSVAAAAQLLATGSSSSMPGADTCRFAT